MLNWVKTEWRSREPQWNHDIFSVDITCGARKLHMTVHGPSEKAPDGFWVNGSRIYESFEEAKNRAIMEARDVLVSDLQEFDEQVSA